MVSVWHGLKTMIFSWNWWRSYCKLYTNYDFREFFWKLRRKLSFTLKFQTAECSEFSANHMTSLSKLSQISGCVKSQKILINQRKHSSITRQTNVLTFQKYFFENTASSSTLDSQYFREFWTVLNLSAGCSIFYMMTEDREVLREVWQGRIPTAFVLATEDMTSAVLSPETFYLMLPRLSYFALCTEKVITCLHQCKKNDRLWHFQVRKYFSKFVNEDVVNESIWFEHHGTPLRMHLPIGVTYDQLKFENEAGIGPPWTITVRFGNFPEQDILRCTTKWALGSFSYFPRFYYQLNLK